MKKQNAITHNTIPNNVVDLRAKEVNIQIEDETVSLIDLEKIFFLSKLNPDPAFIASILKLDVKKIGRIVNSCRFQEIVNEYLAEYISGNAGEKPEQLTLRYKEFLQECFTSLRVTIGMKIRKSIEDDKPLDGKYLNINLIEKLMRLEFALHGLPIDIKGFLHATKKDSSDKTEAELMQSLNGIKEQLERANRNSFNPSSFIDDSSNEIMDADIDDGDSDSS